ncbi:bifunctional phosphoribosyl-AMP cyclohydrolase/phosphoribosyl-ATP diphosphatase HisIE [uncultured Campylobacter sp.]|uniref:bifunctional phosphoribosyl-AMP cyclohydrolase/phosphoribosyl-ATP diphosphatase HisIE n=1 Tax=uncultured Campylobacter sp. TaxID=218934 RepID=UPI00261CFE0F|nr:bifunctional phosphoribosyl-AMP cyclohydrolase/phosphoribosyl-ATP diphosphatase HisIE [uncultured Campylobacter sp.]
MSEDIINKVDWQKVSNLLPVVVQDYKSSEVLMLGYMNKEALEKSLKEKRVSFFSRSKNRLWTKGESSGNFLDIVELGLDCDNDSLLILAKPHGVTCHSGNISCFEACSSKADFVFLSRLANLVKGRKNSDETSSYTAKLFKEGTKRIAQKVGEEGVETALAATVKDKEELKNEAADLIFHLIVLLEDAGLSLNDVLEILKQRNSSTKH